MGAVYKWKAHANFGIPAQVAGEELERIRTERKGRLIPAVVVDEARPEEAPLHPAFEWDDAVAAEQYREGQARNLIRHVTVTVQGSGTEPRTVRAFVNVVEGESQSYTSTVHAMSDRRLREQVVARALAEAEQWRARYQELAELADVFEAIERAGRRRARAA